ncbi:MAG: PAS domain S-box protein [Candidatus Melainabacteria bacterium]|nr:PAS domain S-box protein [Candidatus Melainabacteria bacterium]
MEHLRTPSLIKTTSYALEQLKAATLGLNCLVELGVKLGSERDPKRLLEGYCKASCSLIGAKYAAVGVLQDDGQQLCHYFVTKSDGNALTLSEPVNPRQEMLKTVFADKRCLRLENLSGNPAGFPSDHPPINSFLCAPIVTDSRSYGWLYLVDKVGQPEFTDEDERLAVNLTKMLAVVYENARLFEQLQHQANELAESERHTRLLIESGYDAFVVMDEDGKITEWSNQAEQLLGWSQGEAVGKALADIVIPPAIKENELVTSFLSTRQHQFINKRMEFSAQHRDGHKLAVELVLFPVKSGETSSLCALVHDITERKLAHEMSLRALEAEKNVARAIFEHAPTGIARLDNNLNILEINKVFREQLSLTAQSICNQNIFAILPQLPQESLNSAISLNTHFSANSYPLECETQSERNPTYWDIALWPVKNENNSSQGAVLLMSDVTERVRIAQQREDFAATLTHDLKAPLIGADRTLSLLLDSIDPEMHKEQARLISLLKKSNSALLDMVHMLLDSFRYEAGLESVHFQKLNLPLLITQCLDELTPLADQRTIKFNVGPVDSPIEMWADHLAVRRMLINLVSNAIKFTDNAGLIEVHLRHSSEDEVTIVVKDSGKGIPQEDQARLFERFWRGGAQRTYPASTGLGLYLCRQIVEAHGGKIFCESHVGQGTTISVTLPTRASTMEVSQ